MMMMGKWLELTSSSLATSYVRPQSLSFDSGNLV